MAGRGAGGEVVGGERGFATGFGERCACPRAEDGLPRLGSALWAEMREVYSALEG